MDTRAPEILEVMRATWSAPMTPTPRTPIRSSDMGFRLLSWCGETDGRDPTGPEIAAGALRDRQRRLDVAGIHVLLDDREDVDAELVHGGQQRRHIGDPARRFGHRAELDGLAERQILGLHPGPPPR